MKKKQILNTLNALAEYIEAGIADYLSDNSLEDYIDHGDFDSDYQNLIAVRRIRAFITTDEYPWWEQFQVTEDVEEDSTHDDTHA